MNGRYGDVELLLTGWLASALTVRTCTELPATLPDRIVQVVRFGGAPGGIPFDDARVDVDCYATTRKAALDLAADVQRALMYALPGSTFNGTRVIAAQCDSGPSWAPYDNTTVRRSTAAYTIRTHNPI